MYEFRDINEEQNTEVNIPKESVLINGEHMENLIEGFRTLTVTGRELVNRSIESVKIEGRDGSLYLGSNLEPRTLKVRYLLEAEDEGDFRDKFNLMNQVLQSPQMEIRFNDELEYYYIGTLSSVGEVPRGRNVVTSEFEIYCSDGYKYSDPMELSGSNEVEMSIETPYRTLPVEIEVTPENDTDTITIINSDKEIRLVGGSFVGGSPVSIVFGDEIVVNSANGDDTDKVALNSDLEDFEIKNGDTVQFVEGGNIEILVSKVMI